MDLPYKVYNRDGALVAQIAEECRYEPDIELSLLTSGHTIELHGKKITKKMVEARLKE